MLPNPLEDIARRLVDYEKRLSHLERLEGGGGWTLIEDKHLSVAAASLDFTSIPADFAHLILEFSLRTDKVAVTYEHADVVLNNDTGNNYDYLLEQWTNVVGLATAEVYADAAFTDWIVAHSATAPANTFATGWLKLIDYADASNYTTLFMEQMYELAAAAGDLRSRKGQGYYKSATPIGRITITPADANDFIAGSRATLYGLVGLH